ncbi:FDLD family class I lanthipeptide [Cytobacillus sp. IB215665]|uniref:FDLD family class I lanthipeptide n=1 Tax=Cytobacillus sp. IB215665 TaxID=3097357 RepID=UPI0039B77B0F
MNKNIFDLDLQIKSSSNSNNTIEGLSAICLTTPSCNCYSEECISNDCNATEFSDCGCGTTDIC